MKPKLNRIMLVDDNPNDNFFHHRVIKKADLDINIIIKDTGRAAIDYLLSKDIPNNPTPDLIFLDINMPSMNGWEFLEEFNMMDKKIQEKAVIVMLTNSENPIEIKKAKEYTFVYDYLTKPLTHEMVEKIHKLKYLK